MTTRMMLKQWNDILVPAAGEIVVEQGTNKIKIGDGKTNFANLPYVEDNPPEMTLSEQAKEVIENNIEYLEANDYETFYSHITSVALAREVSKALFKAGLNPKEHLKECPRGCESIFYYEGGYDPNEEFKETIKQRGWANLINPHPNRGKTQYQWITTSPKNDKYYLDYIIDYDVDKELKDYLKPKWKLEDDE